MTGSSAKQMASDQTWLEVSAPLVRICVEDSKQDPQVAETLAQLKAIGSYQRSDIFMTAG